MRNNILVLIIATVLFSCNQTNQQSIDQTTGIPQKGIGGGKDKHGCLTGAGQTWSQLAQTCIQVFKEAKRLNPVVKKDDEAIISAFVLMNEDATVCELFLPYDDATSVLLAQKADNNYKEGDYRYNSKENTLYIKEKAAYKAED